MSPSREVDRTPPIVCAGLGQVLGAGFGTVVGLLIAGLDSPTAERVVDHL